MDTEKCVIVIDESMPLGIIANTAAILGITIGAKIPAVVGQDVFDAEAGCHSGIIRFPVPILKGSSKKLRELHEKLTDKKYTEFIWADFSELAQGCRTYDEFIAKMSDTPERELGYIGIAICGGKKEVNTLTGNMPLLR